MKRKSCYRKKVVFILFGILISAVCVLYRTEDAYAKKVNPDKLYTPNEIRSGKIFLYNAYYDADTTNIQIEVGKQFNIGNYARYREKNSDKPIKQVRLSLIDDTKYTVSNKDILSVSKNGDLKSKKTGKTKVVCKVKSSSVTFKIEVVKKGKLSKGKDYKEALKYAQKLQKAIPKKITSQNCLDSMQAYLEYRENMKKYPSMNKDGRINKNRKMLAVTEADAYYCMENMLELYDYRTKFIQPGGKYIPNGGKGFLDIESMTSDPVNQTLIFNLKEPLTENELFELKYNKWFENIYTYDGIANMDNSSDSCTVEMYYFLDKTDNKIYKGIINANLNSRTVSVKLYDELYNIMDYQKNVSLISGHVYCLLGTLQEGNVMANQVETVMQ